MSALKLRRVKFASGNGPQEFAALCAERSVHGDAVSPRSRQLTIDVFGEPLTPSQVVERICTDVRRRGLDAVLEYTEKLDQTRLAADGIRISPDELSRAHAAVDPAFLQTIRRVRAQITEFQRGLLPAEFTFGKSASNAVHVRYRPIRRVGICVPGGAAAYPSTLLMTVCPAQAADVKEIAVVMPPTRFGAYNQNLQATCRELGVTEVYCIGGAQAIAALAYGVDGIRAVDMIVGPGNLFVALAKKYVFGQVAIDMLAGPSEVVVIADDAAEPEYVAADLIAQAEHAPGASILITPSEALIDAVADALERQMNDLPRGALAREALENLGALVLVRDLEEAAACTNTLAPEHVHIQTRAPERVAEMIEHAGAVFLGNHTPVALGDYVAGPSHVLPTGGTARFASGLAASDFLRRTSVISYTETGLRDAAEDVRRLAQIEGLTAHAASVDVRLNR